ncbi:cyanidin 3-O-rutinoside 5-O-glucosyltransferase-like [Dendrobium catenatum]|uniref:Glycosyltransferase n=1 Tax=Dendrobium catenatum TaxID=906689 RepID=A0A2I0VCL1_9ASPA|nr:cyanidin 3-O-rutinoside 5-O-glucosyltransferase-like [Dendrobium catenatum]PKU61145.1 Cyanidin 3-O-rutinoside 5-O-glucosyltransferase [Dendrobium catenatum]
MANNHHHGQGHHFLLVTIAAQGQINPARHLARRLARIAGARVTLATPLSSHRHLFPESLAAAGEPDKSAEEAPLNPDGSGIVAYAPYSDGFDEGAHMDNVEADVLMGRLKSVGSRTLAALVRNFAEQGYQITCVLHTILLTWAADVARDLGIPAIHYWIQPASVFAIYYRYFQDHQGFASAIAEEKEASFSIELPGLPTLRMKDLPSIMSKPNPFLSAHEEIFKDLAKYEKPKVLVNTFYELEASVIDETPEFELITIGPVVDKSFVPATTGSKDLFKEDAGGYMEWLDAQEERSVVYVAFGSLTRLTVRQVEELDRGLKESGRPYLWVLRKDSRPEGVGVERIWEEGSGKGKVVEWCSQVKVLGHKAVGCFVTHGGWNSTSEALVSGVPMVMLPQWIEQATNARLVEAAWGIGLRVEAGEDKVVEAGELSRGLDVVMGEGERAKEIRRKAEEWKEKARAALAVGGSSSKNLKAFVHGL